MLLTNYISHVIFYQLIRMYTQYFFSFKNDKLKIKNQKKKKIKNKGKRT